MKLLIGVILAAAIFLSLASVLLVESPMPQAIVSPAIPLRQALWHFRFLDVLGQLALLITATFGVLVLVKERR